MALITNYLLYIMANYLFMTCVTQTAEFDSAITVYLKFSYSIKSKTRSNNKRVLSQDKTRTGIL